MNALIIWISEREREREREREGGMLRVHVNLRLRVSLYKQWGLVTSKQRFCRLIADKYDVVTCESVACRSYFTNKSFRAVCARSLWYVCACVYESSEASAYSFGLATNPNPTRARRYPLNINPKPDPKPDSISGPAGSGRVADLYDKRIIAIEQII